MKHDIEKLKVRFRDLLDMLTDEYGMSEYIDDSDSESFEYNWEEFSEAVEDIDVWMATGASKVVIGDEMRDYVIKFQLPGSDFNYCEREVETYHEAIALGLESRFAWCAKLFNYPFVRGKHVIIIPIYVMEYCECGYESIDSEVHEYKYKEFCSEHGYEENEDSLEEFGDSCWDADGPTVLEWAFSEWGSNEGERQEVISFLYKMRINDLHPGNWGWCNGHLVMIDYSGYGEDLEERVLRY